MAKHSRSQPDQERIQKAGGSRRTKARHDLQPRMSVDHSVHGLQQKVGNYVVQRLVNGGAREEGVSNGIEGKIEEVKRRGYGQSLDHKTRQEMDSVFGADFGPVRVHTDAKADELNHILGASAFTTGHDIFFRAGEYVPSKIHGRGLIAHELTHVLQQTDRPAPKLQIGSTGDACEREAEQMASLVTDSERSVPTENREAPVRNATKKLSRSENTVQRSPDPSYRIIDPWTGEESESFTPIDPWAPVGVTWELSFRETVDHVRMGGRTRYVVRPATPDDELVIESFTMRPTYPVPHAGPTSDPAEEVVFGEATMPTTGVLELGPEDHPPRLTGEVHGIVRYQRRGRRGRHAGIRMELHNIPYEVIDTHKIIRAEIRLVSEERVEEYVRSGWSRREREAEVERHRWQRSFRRLEDRSVTEVAQRVATQTYERAWDAIETATRNFRRIHGEIVAGARGFATLSQRLRLGLEGEAEAEDINLSDILLLLLTRVGGLRHLIPSTLIPDIIIDLRLRGEAESETGAGLGVEAFIRGQGEYTQVRDRFERDQSIRDRIRSAIVDRGWRQTLERAITEQRERIDSGTVRARREDASGSAGERRGSEVHHENVVPVLEILEYRGSHEHRR